MLSMRKRSVVVPVGLEFDIDDPEQARIVNGLLSGGDFGRYLKDALKPRNHRTTEDLTLWKAGNVVDVTKRK
jgi:hypothetical protein